MLLKKPKDSKAGRGTNFESERREGVGEKKEKKIESGVKVEADKEAKSVKGTKKTAKPALGKKTGVGKKNPRRKSI